MSNSSDKYDFGMIGLGTMGRNLLLNMGDHGVAADTLELDLDKATQVLEALKKGGIDIDKITQQLEDEGIDKFNKPFEKLLKAIEDQKNK